MRRKMDDQGVTLLEVLSVMVLAGILMTLAVGPWRNYQTTQDHLGAARQVVATLRNAQVAATAEETSYTVTVATRTLTVRRLDPVSGTSTVVRTTKIDNTALSLTDADFAGGAVVTFSARGTATAGDLKVRRTGKAKVYTITVEGLTARVSFT